MPLEDDPELESWWSEQMRQLAADEAEFQRNYVRAHVAEDAEKLKVETAEIDADILRLLFEEEQ